MRFVTVVGASCLAASVVFLPASAPAAAGSERITGKLSKPGYTVIGLAANGKAKTVRATRGRFRLRPPARRLTLHLRAPNGKYAGPIVVGSAKEGRRAIVGVKAGARLGRVKVRTGYATLSKRLRKKWVDPSRMARARRGVPLGARSFGRVRSRPPAGAWEMPWPDLDLDGAPNLLDIDDDGDLLLDNFDRRPLFYGGSRRGTSTWARAAQVSDEPDADHFGVRSVLLLDLHQTSNANHPALAAQIDTALSSFGELWFGLKGAGPLPAGAELDCAQPQTRFDPSLGGLRYCSRGGTGRISTDAGLVEFPECCDPGPGDPPGGDGFGTLTPSGPAGVVFLRHGATTDQIGTGDLLILRASDRDRPATVQSLIATVPALVSYDDDGPAGRDPTPVAYPVSGPPPGLGHCPPAGPPCEPGTFGNGFPVAPRPAGDPNAGEVVLTLKYWRPQRKPIARDACLPACEWIDLGGLNYGVQVGGLGLVPQDCPQEAFSENDPKLVLNSSLPTRGEIRDGFTDTGPDRAASPTKTFTYTLNLTRCLESRGLGHLFDEPGEQQGFQFGGKAATRADAAAQGVFFTRQ